MAPPVLPAILRFPAIGICYYEVVGERRPEPLEYFVVQSRDMTQVLRAQKQLAGNFTIVRPTHKAHAHVVYERGEEIKPAVPVLPACFGHFRSAQHDAEMDCARCAVEHRCWAVFRQAFKEEQRG
jgi:hypothetical protein